MPIYELTKNIEAKKLNKRTLVPTGGPPATIPYGAILDNLTEERDLVKFTYLGEPFQSNREEIISAITPIQPQEAEPAAGAPASQKPAAAEATGPAAPALQWERVTSSHQLSVMRAKVHDGWLVLVDGGGLTYYPDPKHRWI